MLDAMLALAIGIGTYAVVVFVLYVIMETGEEDHG